MRGTVTPRFRNSTVSPLISYPWHSRSFQVQVLHSPQDASSDLGSSFSRFHIYVPSSCPVKCHILLALKAPVPLLRPSAESFAWALPSSSQARCPTVMPLSAFQAPSNLFKEISHWCPGHKESNTTDVKKDSGSASS